jgi:hypothetical protein
MASGASLDKTSMRQMTFEFSDHTRAQNTPFSSIVAFQARHTSVSRIQALIRTGRASMTSWKTMRSSSSDKRCISAMLIDQLIPTRKSPTGRVALLKHETGRG